MTDIRISPSGPSVGLTPNDPGDNNRVAFALNGLFAFAPFLKTDGNFLSIGGTVPASGLLRLAKDSGGIRFIDGGTDIQAVEYDTALGNVFGSNSRNTVLRALAMYDFLIAGTSRMKLDAEGIFDVRTVGFTERDDGNTGATKTIDWSLGQKQRSTLNAATITVTHTFSRAGNYIWRILNTTCTSLTLAVTGGVAKFPLGVLQLGGTASSQVSVVAIYYDGTDAHFTSAPDSQTGTVSFI